MRRISALFPYLLATLMVVAVALPGCKGKTGPTGPSGTNPPLPPVITSVVAIPDSIGTGESTVLIVNAYDPNGDALTYAWTTTYGALSTPNQAYTRWSPPDSIGLYTVGVAVTAGSQTTNGSVLVGVNMYVPAVTPSYLGTDEITCGHCHQAKISDWHTTAHSTVFDTTFIGIAERTTGYDPTVDNGGYDDNPGPWLENVQCEACHGPQGPDVGDHRNLSPGALSGASCGQCHAEWPEYQYSGHGTVIQRVGGAEAFTAEWGGSSCRGCHISEGFLMIQDPDWANRPFPQVANQIACGTCHNAHMDTGNEFQIRTQDDFNLPYGGESNPGAYTITGWGKGQLCGQCHHSRRDRTGIMGQIANGNQHFGPHDSPQADMIAGRGSYEITGMTYDSTNQHQQFFVSGGALEDVCVSCHMIDLTTPYPHAKHTFYPDVQNCYGCHQQPVNFDIDGVQTEIDSLLTALAVLLPHDSTGAVPSDTRTGWTTQEREAGWAYFFVTADASKGVHNHAYARTLLVNAITYLTPPGPQFATGNNRRN